MAAEGSTSGMRSTAATIRCLEGGQMAGAVTEKHRRFLLCTHSRAIISITMGAQKMGVNCVNRGTPCRSLEEYDAGLVV